MSDRRRSQGVRVRYAFIRAYRREKSTGVGSCNTTFAARGVRRCFPARSTMTISFRRCEILS